jgi:hypothetical protein
MPRSSSSSRRSWTRSPASGRLLQDLEKLPGAPILDGRFTAVQRAVGTAQANEAGAR